MHPIPGPGGRRGAVGRLGLVALLISAAGLGLLALAGPGYQAGWFSLGTALQRMQAWAAYLGLAGVALAAAALVLGARRGTPAVLVALLALGIGGAAVVIPWRWQQTARAVPRIHDISTDTVTPPAFVAIASLRQALNAPNSLEYTAEFAAQQREGYPDLGPLMLTIGPDEAYARALDAARARGWEIVAADPAARRIEATDTTFWFGFKDDVAVRVSAMPGGGSRIDVRSVSRVGRSDVGTNARRIRAYLVDLGR